MKRSDFYYELPKELIAQTPLADRSSSRLLALDRQTGAIRHGRFAGIKDELRSGDCLVINDTRVMPARLFGKRAEDGSKAEFLLLEDRGQNEWEALVKPGRKAKPGNEYEFGDRLRARIKRIEDGGNRTAVFYYDGPVGEALGELGETPLPPYITQKLNDPERYQTVYSAKSGSAAAPTAGLHFTRELLEDIRKRGVSVATLTLHIGTGTFRPVRAENVEDHVMHKEYYNIDDTQAEIINGCRKNGGRIIAVGTTCCRVLESVALPDGNSAGGSGYTDMFIKPGYKFKTVDGLITNFHLPESTLIMLVCAFAGRERVLEAYSEAIKLSYRLLSFGDVMYVY